MSEAPQSSLTFAERLTFLWLALMGMAVYCLCIIVPPTHERMQLERELSSLDESISLLQEEVERGEYVIRELRTNPIHVQQQAIVNGYQPDLEPRIPVVPEDADYRPAHSVVHVIQRPAAASRPTTQTAGSLAAGVPYAEAFLDPDKRLAMLVLSGALVTVAFLLFGRRGPAPMPGRSSPAPIVEIKD